MATVEFDVFHARVKEQGPTERMPSAPEPGRFHRIQEIRRREGMSLRSAARQLGCDTKTVRLQEQSTTDLKISDLHRWQKALDVPLSELLVESEDSLSGPILERARMVRLMKTVAAIKERAEGTPVCRLATMLTEQILEIMPELEDVGPWHSVGQRRSANDLGRVFEQQYSLGSSGGDSDRDD